MKARMISLSNSNAKLFLKVGQQKFCKAVSLFLLKEKLHEKLRILFMIKPFLWQQQTGPFEATALEVSSGLGVPRLEARVTAGQGSGRKISRQTRQPSKRAKRSKRQPRQQQKVIHSGKYLSYTHVEVPSSDISFCFSDENWTFLLGFNGNTAHTHAREKNSSCNWVVLIHYIHTLIYSGSPF